MGLPDFLVIGAMKSGTTTLAAQLAAQPGVFMATPKEPNFFSDDEIFTRGMGWYGSLFEAAAPGQIRGEASTHYTKLPTHPHTLSRLRPVLEAPKLIYMIRHPVERLVSHYIHGCSRGEIRAGLGTAVDTHSELVDYGRYAMQIAPWIEAYGAGAVLLTSLEQIKADPQAELDRIGRFLGASAPLVWQTGIKAQNTATERFRRLPAHRLLVGNPVAQALRRTLVPRSFRAWVKRKRSFETPPRLADDLRLRLEAIYAKDRADLARFFPGHPALSTCYPFCR